jgi:hypothetical protein
VGQRPLVFYVLLLARRFLFLRRQIELSVEQPAITYFYPESDLKKCPLPSPRTSPSAPNPPMPVALLVIA